MGWGGAGGEAGWGAVGAGEARGGQGGGCLSAPLALRFPVITGCEEVVVVRRAAHGEDSTLTVHHLDPKNATTRGGWQVVVHVWWDLTVRHT